MSEVVEQPKAKFLRSEVWALRNKLQVGGYLVLLNTTPFNKLLAHNKPRLIEYKSSTSLAVESLSKAGIVQWVDLPSIKTLIAKTEDTFTLYQEGVKYTYKFIPESKLNGEA